MVECGTGSTGNGTQPSRSCLASRSVLIDKGLRGTIPWPDGWKLPATITDISLGNTKEPPQNQLRGPLPPNWQLPPSEPGGAACVGALPLQQSLQYAPA